MSWPWAAAKTRELGRPEQGPAVAEGSHSRQERRLGTPPVVSGMAQEGLGVPRPGPDIRVAPSQGGRRFPEIVGRILDRAPGEGGLGGHDACVQRLGHPPRGQQLRGRPQRRLSQLRVEGPLQVVGAQARVVGQCPPAEPLLALEGTMRQLRGAPGLGAVTGQEGGLGQEQMNLRQFRVKPRRRQPLGRQLTDPPGLGDQPHGEQGLAAVQERLGGRGHAERHSFAVGGVVAFQGRRYVSSPGGQKAQVVVDVGRLKLLAQLGVEPFGQEEVGLGGAVFAAIGVKDGPVRQQGRLVDDITEAAHRRQCPPVHLERLFQAALALHDKGAVHLQAGRHGTAQWGAARSICRSAAIVSPRYQRTGPGWLGSRPRRRAPGRRRWPLRPIAPGAGGPEASRCRPWPPCRGLARRWRWPAGRYPPQGLQSQGAGLIGI